MAVTLTSRPSTWSAVKNPVVYKFSTTGGPFTNYRIDVEVFKASDNTSLTGGIKFSFTPDKDNVTYADVSTIIKAYLKAALTTFFSNNYMTESDLALKFYIKYQELYDGSATSVIDDVANQYNVLNAALQIAPFSKRFTGSDGEKINALGNNMNDYVIGGNLRRFLTKFMMNPLSSSDKEISHMRMWRDYPFTISFIWADGKDTIYRRVKQYDASGTLLDEKIDLINETLESTSIADGEGKVCRLKLPTINTSTKWLDLDIIILGTAEAAFVSNPSFVTTLNPWTNSGAGTNWAWATGDKAQVVLSAAGTSATLKSGTFTDKASGFYRLTFQCGTSAINQSTIRAWVWDNGVKGQLILNYNPRLSSIEGIIYETIVKIDQTFDQIGFEIEYPAGSTFDMFSFDLKPQTNFASQTAVLKIVVEEVCANPVYLFWKNSLAGDSYYMFQYNHQDTYQVSPMKSKRQVLYAEHVDRFEWEALQDLLSNAEVYRNNIIELNNSVLGSHTRDGHLVYVVYNGLGDKIGVIVIPTSNAINTRDEVHSIEIEIEYPEIIE
jgi:hypothetical protein